MLIFLIVLALNIFSDAISEKDTPKKDDNNERDRMTRNGNVP